MRGTCINRKPQYGDSVTVCGWSGCVVGTHLSGEKLVFRGVSWYSDELFVVEDGSGFRHYVHRDYVAPLVEQEFVVRIELLSPAAVTDVECVLADAGFRCEVTEVKR